MKLHISWSDDSSESYECDDSSESDKQCNMDFTDSDSDSDNDATYIPDFIYAHTSDSEDAVEVGRKRVEERSPLQSSSLRRGGPLQNGIPPATGPENVAEGSLDGDSEHITLDEDSDDSDRPVSRKRFRKKKLARVRDPSIPLAGTVFQRGDIMQGDNSMQVNEVGIVVVMSPCASPFHPHVRMSHCLRMRK